MTFWFKFAIFVFPVILHPSLNKKYIRSHVSRSSENCHRGCRCCRKLSRKQIASRGHEVEIFEASKSQDHWPVCAWGASRHMLEKFSSESGLDFSKYTLHVGQRLRMELPAEKKGISRAKRVGNL